MHSSIVSLGYANRQIDPPPADETKAQAKEPEGPLQKTEVCRTKSRFLQALNRSPNFRLGQQRRKAFSVAVDDLISVENSTGPSTIASAPLPQPLPRPKHISTPTMPVAVPRTAKDPKTSLTPKSGSHVNNKAKPNSSISRNGQNQSTNYRSTRQSPVDNNGTKENRSASYGLGEPSTRATPSIYPFKDSFGAYDNNSSCPVDSQVSTSYFPDSTSHYLIHPREEVYSRSSNKTITAEINAHLPNNKISNTPSSEKNYYNVLKNQNPSMKWICDFCKWEESVYQPFQRKFCFRCRCEMRMSFLS
jgi:hypothetical protein